MAPRTVVVQSAPFEDPEARTGWSVMVRNVGPPEIGDITVVVSAICARNR